MALVDVKGERGYVYDDEAIRTNEDGVKYSEAHFDEKRAKHLGLSEKEIKTEQRNVKVILVELK